MRSAVPSFGAVACLVIHPVQGADVDELGLLPRLGFGQLDPPPKRRQVATLQLQVGRAEDEQPDFKLDRRVVRSDPGQDLREVALPEVRKIGHEPQQGVKEWRRERLPWQEASE